MTTVIVVLVAAVIGLLVLFVALQPADFTIERTGTIAAPPSAVFPHVNDFHKWAAWSPWEHIDPDLERTYEGPEAGPGASYAWSGNREVGQGRMTITESRPGERIEIRLEFLKPFTATNTTEFTFTPESGGTRVNWRMSGRNNFMAKAFGVVMNMDTIVGGQFEKGLASLKTVAESHQS